MNPRSLGDIIFPVCIVTDIYTSSEYFDRFVEMIFLSSFSVHLHFFIINDSRAVAEPKIRNSPCYIFNLYDSSTTLTISRRHI